MSELSGLSPRQKEIAELIADGKSDKAIQALLGISSGTLRTQINRMAERMGLEPSTTYRLQIMWLVINARYDADPSYRCPTPSMPHRVA